METWTKTYGLPSCSILSHTHIFNEGPTQHAMLADSCQECSLLRREIGLNTGAVTCKLSTVWCSDSLESFVALLITFKLLSKQDKATLGSEQIC